MYNFIKLVSMFHATRSLVSHAIGVCFNVSILVYGVEPFLVTNYE